MVLITSGPTHEQIDAVRFIGNNSSGKMGYELVFRNKSSGPINAIEIDQERKTFKGGASDFGEDYGVAW